MLSKRQKIILVSSFCALILLSCVAAIVACISYKISTMYLNDSSPEFGGISDEGRFEVFNAAHNLLFCVTLALGIVAALWAVLAATILCLWIKASRKIKTDN